VRCTFINFAGIGYKSYAALPLLYRRIHTNVKKLTLSGLSHNHSGQLGRVVK
jgi:hypothetical protein